MSECAERIAGRLLGEMAKLSARGRTELLRMSKQTSNPDEETEWRKTTYAFMSDGNMLVKSQVRYKPTQFEPEGRTYGGEWKIVGQKYAPEKIQQVRQDMQAKGYKEETGR